jgi:hypothetical protein
MKPFVVACKEFRLVGAVGGRQGDQYSQPTTLPICWTELTIVALRPAFSSVAPATGAPVRADRHVPQRLVRRAAVRAAAVVMDLLRHYLSCPSTCHRAITHVCVP